MDGIHPEKPYRAHDLCIAGVRGDLPVYPTGNILVYPGYRGMLCEVRVTPRDDWPYPVARHLWIHPCRLEAL